MIEMITNQSYKLSVIFFLFGQIFFLPNGIKAIKTDIGHILNIPNAINAILSHQNWTENNECSIELNSIKMGIENREEWVKKCECDFEANLSMEYDKKNRSIK